MLERCYTVSLLQTCFDINSPRYCSDLPPLALPKTTGNELGWVPTGISWNSVQDLHPPSLGDNTRPIHDMIISGDSSLITSRPSPSPCLRDNTQRLATSRRRDHQDSPLFLGSFYSSHAQSFCRLFPPSRWNTIYRLGFVYRIRNRRDCPQYA